MLCRSTSNEFRVGNSGWWFSMVALISMLRGAGRRNDSQQIRVCLFPSKKEKKRTKKKRRSENKEHLGQRVETTYLHQYLFLQIQFQCQSQSSAGCFGRTLRIRRKTCCRLIQFLSQTANSFVRLRTSQTEYGLCKFESSNW